VLTYHETRDGRQIRYTTLPFLQSSTEVLKRMFRSTLIPSSTSLVTRSHLGPLMYFRCLLKARRRGESRSGRIMKMMKTSQKVRSIYDAYIEAPHHFPIIDATALDIWVLDQLDLLFRNATTNKLLDAQLRAPQVVFFLHLLGLDTTGHTYRPHSKVSYVHTI
jgi:hypothetical protein